MFFCEPHATREPQLVTLYIQIVRWLLNNELEGRRFGSIHPVFVWRD
jgi:hypothetical protein